jgi:hypothetical protein
MGHTTLSSFPSSTVKENAQTNYVSSNYTLVYDGTVSWTVGWVEIVLQTPFPWNNTNNLLIKWENRNNAYTFDEPWFYYTSKTNTVAYKVLDASYPTADGVRGSLRPNIKIALADPVGLPIELLYFKGKKMDDGNLLEWESATELNNDYYTIYRSNYPIDWSEIVKIDGVGTSTFSNHYHYLDRDFSNDVNYYYLTQTDFDGKTKKYEIISIDNRYIVSELVRITNILGQDINFDTPGLKIFYYTDGTIVKRY